MPGWKHLGTKFKLVGMPDINTRDAFHGVLGGVGGIAHVAIDMDMNTHSQRIIDETVKSNLQLLNVAAKEPSVKSVVIMSSSAACALPTTGVPCKVNLKTWNNAVIEQTTSPWHSEGNSRWHGIIPYEASKVRGEQEASAWHVVSPENISYRSSSAITDAVVKGSPAAPTILPSQWWYIDVEDMALLHLGALTLDDVHDERVLAFVDADSRNFE